MQCPYPVTSVLGDIFTDLLGGQTERTDLGSQSGLGSDLTTSHTQVTLKIVRNCSLQKKKKKKATQMGHGILYIHDLHLIGVELGSYPEVTGQSPAIIKPRR